MRAVVLRRAGRARTLPACLAAGLVLGGCGAGDSEADPGGVTVGEARALDEAAEMLDERRLPDETLPAAQKTANELPTTRET